MTHCDEVCGLDPFNSQITPEGRDLEILRYELEDYLRRLKDAICSDINCLGGESPSYQPPITVATMDSVDFPSIGSNSAVSLDFTMPVTLGMHIISWAPVTDATSIQDLLIQILVVADNTVRVTMQNPTAGAIDPDPISLQFIVATAEDTP